MTIPWTKSVLALVVGGLSLTSHLGLPAPWGGLVSALLAVAAYFADHDALVASAKRVAGVGLVALACVAACTPAERQALGVPALSTIDAAGIAIAHAVGWCEDHGADAQAVRDAKVALADRSPGEAVAIVRRMLEASAAAGEAVPPDVVALVQLAEGALAAQSIQDGMRAVSK